MGEPAQKLNSDENPIKPDIKPELSVLPGGGETTDREKGHLKALDPEHLNEAEESGGDRSSGAGSAGAAKEQSALGDDQVGAGYNSDDTGRFGSKKGRFRGLSRRKKIFGGGVVGTIITGALIFSVGQGPFQLVHLSQILGKGMLPNALTADTRLPHMYKFMGARNVAETRLGVSGKLFYRHLVSKLSKIGIDINITTRGYADAKINVAKLFPDLEGLPHTRQISEVARRLGDMAPESFRPGTSPDILEVDHKALDGSGYNKFTTNAIKSLGKGRLASWLATRILKIAHNVPNIFHPFRYVERAVDIPVEKFIDTSKNKRTEARQKTQSTATKKASAAKDKIKNAVDSKTAKALSFVSLGLDVACTVYNIAEVVPIVNWGHVVVPAMIESLDVSGTGSQIMNGQDFNQLEIGARTDGLTDENGKSVWEAKSLNALANNSEGVGENLSNKYRQAFSPGTTEEQIKSFVGGPIGTFMGKSAGIVCSLPAQIINAVGGIVLVAATGGTWTAGKAGVTAGKTVLISSLIARISSEAIDELSIDPVKAFSGPVGGNLMAYGIRAANNSVGRMGGGVELDPEEEVAIWQTINKQESEEFKQKSFFARLFDLNDYRSLASMAIRKTPSNLNGPTNVLASIIMSPLKSIASLVGGLLPTAQAVGHYEYGFPLYGIPASVLNDPKFEDPYDNAEQAAKIFNRGDYIDKAKNCFGVKITKGAEGWDSIPQDDVNPADKPYAEAGCDELNDDWKRVMMFVYDSRLMSTMTCYEGIDENACKKLGFGGPEAPQGDEAGDEAGTCAAGTDAGIGDGYKNGQLHKIQLCNVQGMKVNAQIASTLDAMLNSSRAAGLVLSTNNQAFRTMAEQEYFWHCFKTQDPSCPTKNRAAEPGTSNHQMGLAIDFRCNGNGMQYSDACYKWLSINGAAYGFSAKVSGEPWHWSTTGN